MNMLSAGAAFGVVTAVFQNGWGASLLGIDKTGPIEAFLPVLMFPILFGLSMDYEVFLVSRIYEEWHRRRDNTAAVTHGLAATGRTITAAAAIMVLVFGAFILGGKRVIELFGVGLVERGPARRGDRPLGARAGRDDHARRLELEAPAVPGPAAAAPQGRGQGCSGRGRRRPALGAGSRARRRLSATP